MPMLPQPLTKKFIGQIILTPVFRHRSLRERAAEFNGELNLSDEIEWDEPVGSEV